MQTCTGVASYRTDALCKTDMHWWSTCLHLVHQAHLTAQLVQMWVQQEVSGP